MLIIGNFDSLLDSTGLVHEAKRIARINPDGGADTSFKANISADFDDTGTIPRIQSFEVQEDDC